MDDLRQEFPEVFKLLDKLRGDLAMAEFEARQDMDKFRNYYNDEEAAKERWSRFRLETADLRNHIEQIIFKIADVHAARPLPPIVIERA